jgi:hypothetical protein
LKGRFFGKQRHDDAAKEPDRIAFERLLESVAERFQRVLIGKHAVEHIEREHATGADPFGAACGIS